MIPEAMVATITMHVAAESPPIDDITATPVSPACIENAKAYVPALFE